MSMQGIDVHCHLEYMAKNASERREIISEARKKMAAIVSSVADPEDFGEMLELRNEHRNFLFLSAGFHPERMTKYSDTHIDEYISRIRKNSKDVCAIGEVGLDYAYINEDEKIERSRKIFLKFISLANELKKPLVIHSRNAESMNAVHDCIEMLEKHASVPVVFHYFSGSVEEMERALKSGFYISFTTMVCKSKKYRKLAKAAPLEKLLLETDSPWLDPEPQSGSSALTNRPWNIEKSAEVIAKLKGATKEEILSATEENARRVFNI